MWARRVSSLVAVGLSCLMLSPSLLARKHTHAHTSAGVWPKTPSLRYRESRWQFAPRRSQGTELKEVKSNLHLISCELDSCNFAACVCVSPEPALLLCVAANGLKQVKRKCRTSIRKFASSSAPFWWARKAAQDARFVWSDEERPAHAFPANAIRSEEENRKESKSKE